MSATLDDDYLHQRQRLLADLHTQGLLRSTIASTAMARVPRELFVPTYLTHQAYEDAPLSIGLGQTISAPHMVAIMTEALELGPGQRVLEIGSGSGYQAAVLGRAVEPDGHVITVERIRQLAQRARHALEAAGVRNVGVREGDGSLGLPLEGPFDRIIVTAAAPEVPPPLLEQLAIDGRLLVPVGDGRRCELVRVRRARGGYARERLGACAFVPLVGAHGHAREPSL